MYISREVQEVLDKYELEEKDIDNILQEVRKHYPYFVSIDNWRILSTKALERIIEIYNNSKIDLVSGTIKELNVK